jgi:hypothetical protein
MGAQTISCKCLKTCKDVNEEVDLAKSDYYLRSRTGNLKINNDPRALAPFQQIKGVSINSVQGKTELVSNNNINDNKAKVKDTLQTPIIEETEENKCLGTNNNICGTVNTLTNNNNDKNENIENNVSKEQNDDNIIIVENKENSIIMENKEKNNSILSKDNNINNINYMCETSKQNSYCSSIRYIKKLDKNIFITEKIKQAEKNFESPINYEKDLSQYIEDIDNDMLILISAMNSNKGENHTKEDGKIIEQKGEKCLYIGELDKNQKPVGFGVLYTSKGTKYEGNFNKGKLIGLGRYIDEEGTCYEGIFEENNLVSKAKIISINEKGKKVVYFGEVKNFKKNGKGIETCDEYRYEGDFLNNLRHGHGRIEFLDCGDIYEGQFTKGKITGKGLFIWSNNQQYKGDFVDGIKHGKGKYKWPDGTEYEGEYKNGIREGFGLYKWKDGRIFEGTFKNGKPDGKGILTYKGKPVDCEYIDGKPIIKHKKLFQSNEKDI